MNIGKEIFEKIKHSKRIGHSLKPYKEQLESFNGNKLSEKLYCAMNNIIENPICECGNTVEFEQFYRGYRSFCSGSCAQKSTKTREKLEKTCLERYGSNDPFNINNGRERGLNKCNNSLESSEKRKRTCLERYGAESTFGSKKFQEDIRDILFEKYGVRNVSQVPEIFDKILSNSYKGKEYIMPSGKIVTIQGYENLLLDELILEYHEDDIIVEAAKMPIFNYNIGEDDKIHRYFPDVFIAKTNTIYEVKSTYTVKQDLEKNKRKFQSVIDNGFNFELKIY